MPDHNDHMSVSGDDPWLTVPQVSAELKIHPATVRIWIRDGRLRAVRVGREWRVRRSEVDRALMSDASPAYAQEELRAAREPAPMSSPIPAPRQIADHIMTVTPAAASDT